MTDAHAILFAAIVAAVAALVSTAFSFLIARRQQQQGSQIAELQLQQNLRIAEWEQHKKADELFLTALEFLGGGTQKRNLGIAAIKLYWENYPEHRQLCLELLIGSAIYLLNESGQKDRSHEIYNMKRVMDLILVDIPYNRDTNNSYLELKRHLDVWEPKSEDDKGLHLDTRDIKEWKRLLDNRLTSGHA